MKIHGPNAQIVARREWTDGLASFFVKPDEGSVPDFVPGQFANLGLPLGEDWDTETGKAVRRAYSIASPPGEETLELFVRRVDEGELTPRLFRLKAGDGVHLDDRIAGHFTLDGAEPAEDLVLVGTGTGVAPYRAMILAGAHAKKFRRTILLYSDRHVRDLGYIEEFQELAARDSSFLFLPTITGKEPESAWTGLRGRVQQHLEPNAFESLTGAPLAPGRCQVFLCGNPKMVVEMQERLEALEFKRHRKREPGQLHLEKYW